MKLLAALILTVSLILGTLAAITAYMPTLDTVSASSEPLVLHGPVGVDPNDQEKPLIDPGDTEGELEITSEMIDRLQAQDVHRVRVKSFAWDRWDGRWWFLLACAGLLGGAVMIRASGKKAAATATGVQVRTSEASESPIEALRTAHTQVRQLLEQVQPASAAAGEENNRQREHLIIEQLDHLQRDHLDAFVDRRDELIGTYGMTTYAQVMDSFAAAERQINRAWSAAADGVPGESLDCLGEGAAQLEETIRRLEART